MQTKHRLILLLLLSFFILNSSFSIFNSTAHAAQLSNNGNGTVTDSSTGLVWQQAEPGAKTWDNALTYCEGLSLGGADDWRLPNVKELESLNDNTRYNPALDKTYIPNAYSSDYWSSTTYAYNTYNAWTVHFYVGLVASRNKGDTQYFRCVRGGESVELVDHLLSVTVSGGGTSNVTSSPGDINCISGSSCSASFADQTIVNLIPTPSSVAVFNSWDGDCSGSGSCTVIMDADKNVTANFNLAPKAKIGITGYDSFADAYAAASTTDTTLVYLLEDTLLLSTVINKKLNLQGGYKADFSRTTSGLTALQGALTIGTGSVAVDRIVVK